MKERNKWAGRWGAGANRKTGAAHRGEGGGWRKGSGQKRTVEEEDREGKDGGEGGKG